MIPCSIGYKIKKFLGYYRDSFPHATVLPKMHLLEDHLIPFLEEFGVGLGFLGEQGAEGIHARFKLYPTSYQYGQQCPKAGEHNDRALPPDMSTKHIKSARKEGLHNKKDEAVT